MLCLAAAGSLAGIAAAKQRPVGIDDLILAREPSQAALSPDGRTVAYVLRTPSLGDNGYADDLYLVSTDGGGEPRRLDSGGSQPGKPTSLLKQAPTWAPDSRHLVFVRQAQAGAEVRLLDVDSGESRVLVPQAAIGAGYEFQPAYNSAAFAYSPDGEWLAFSARRKPDEPEAETRLRAIDADEDWAPADRRYPASVHHLFLLELASGRVTRLIGERYGVSGFDWSPDGSRLALSLETGIGRFGSIMSTDLFVLDLASRELRPLVAQAGREVHPKWSRDGEWIAFGTQRGTEDWMYGTTLAVVAADGSSAPRPIGARELDGLSGGTSIPVRWSEDGRFIDVHAPHDLGRRLFRVSVADGAVERLTPRADRTYTDIGHSRDGRRVAFVAQGIGVPAEVFVSDAGRIEPRRLTDHNPQWRDLSVPTAERVRWPSADGEWNLHGVLIKPSAYVAGRRYPLLVNVLGGPSMVEQTLNPVFNYPLLVLAERGYLVFIPNTRGRAGYGMDFVHAIRDEGSYVAHPLSDVLGGVDRLVRQGIADPGRLGILGFSYGGTLAANALVRTPRFKAAIYGEGSPNVLDALMNYISQDALALNRDMWGFGNPFEPDVIESARAQSAIYRVGEIETPVLLESGAASAWERDRQFFRALRHFGVPSEWHVYPRSGHGWDEPLLKQDAFRRHIAWLDYWLLGKPYPDREKQRRYDDWKRERGR